MSRIDQFSDAYISGTCTYRDNAGVVRGYTGTCKLWVSPPGADRSAAVPVDVSVVDGLWSTVVYLDVAGPWSFEIRAITPLHGTSGIRSRTVAASDFPERPAT